MMQLKSIQMSNLVANTKNIQVTLLITQKAILAIIWSRNITTVTMFILAKTKAVQKICTNLCMNIFLTLWQNMLVILSLKKMLRWPPILTLNFQWTTQPTLLDQKRHWNILKYSSQILRIKTISLWTIELACIPMLESWTKMMTQLKIMI